jgi:hypothetical protein
MPSLQTVYQVAGKAVTASTVNQTDPFGTGALQWIEIDINVTALSAGASISFTYSRQGSFGTNYPIWTGGIGSTGQVTGDIGPGLTTAVNIGSQGVLSWTLTGTTPTATFSVMIQGR